MFLAVVPQILAPSRLLKGEKVQRTLSFHWPNQTYKVLNFIVIAHFQNNQGSVQKYLGFPKILIWESLFWLEEQRQRSRKNGISGDSVHLNDYWPEHFSLGISGSLSNTEYFLTVQSRQLLDSSQQAFVSFFSQSLGFPFQFAFGEVTLKWQIFFFIHGNLHTMRTTVSKKPIFCVAHYVL